MPREGLPPRHSHKTNAPLAKALQKKSETGVYRSSPRSRGYDSAWDRLSVRFRRQNPWCLFCRQEKREEDWSPTEVADHVLPAREFPELRLVWKNLCPLCAFHHDGLKARMEAYAREEGLLEQLPRWVWDPATRPQQFRSAFI